MRTWGNGIVGKAIAAVGAAAVIIIGQPLMASAAPGPLTITPLGWNVVGLDSNDVTDGPNVFPVGGRVCNTGSDPVTNVDVNWSWLTSQHLRQPRPNTTVRSARASWRQVRAGTTTSTSRSPATLPPTTPRGEFQITATRRLRSRRCRLRRTARSTSRSWSRRTAMRSDCARTCAMHPAAGCSQCTGRTVTWARPARSTSTAKTAPGGYEQLVTAFYFNNSIFQIESFTATLSRPRPAARTTRCMPTPVAGTTTRPAPDYLELHRRRTDTRAARSAAPA